jgi:acetyl-CoA carboxylase beta subunit
MTKKKYYRIDINTTSTTWETCECYVQAESEEEARRLFDKDSGAYEWDNWETQDDELRSWDVENVEYDEWMTKHMAEKETKDAK